MCLWSLEKTSPQASDLLWNFPVLCVFLPYTRRQTIGYKIWETNLWSLLEQKGCVGDWGGTRTGWALAAEALCWVLGPVLGRAIHEAPPDVAGSC